MQLGWNLLVGEGSGLITIARFLKVRERRSESSCGAQGAETSREEHEKRVSETERREVRASRESRQSATFVHRQTSLPDIESQIQNIKNALECTNFESIFIISACQNRATVYWLSACKSLAVPVEWAPRSPVRSALELGPYRAVPAACLIHRRSEASDAALLPSFLNNAHIRVCRCRGRIWRCNLRVQSESANTKLRTKRAECNAWSAWNAKKGDIGGWRPSKLEGRDNKLGLRAQQFEILKIVKIFSSKTPCSIEQPPVYGESMARQGRRHKMSPSMGREMGPFRNFPGLSIPGKNLKIIGKTGNYCQSWGGDSAQGRNSPIESLCRNISVGLEQW